jgi:hypothetical protein
MTTALSDQAYTLLEESLGVWQVHGSIRAGEYPVVADIHGAAAVVRVEIASESERPIRWWVRQQGSEALAAGSAPRSWPCTSTVGLLRGVREALNVDGGRALRIGRSAPEA